MTIFIQQIHRLSKQSTIRDLSSDWWSTLNKASQKRAIPRVHINDITQLYVDSPIRANEHVTSCSLSTGSSIVSHLSLSPASQVPLLSTFLQTQRNNINNKSLAEM